MDYNIPFVEEEEKSLLSAGQDWISLDTISGSQRRPAGHIYMYYCILMSESGWQIASEMERDMRGDWEQEIKEEEDRSQQEPGGNYVLQPNPNGLRVGLKAIKRSTLDG